MSRVQSPAGPDLSEARLVSFEGSSLREIRGFPKGVREDIGYALHRLQAGMQPADFKPMASVGPGVEEIRGAR
jgi:phage-related protein